MKVYVLLFIIITFGSCKQNLIQPHPKNLERPEKNYFATNFVLKDSAEKNQMFYEYLSRATILDFWASWCRPCRESANPYYKKLYKKYHHKGLNIVGVSGDRHRYFWKKALKTDSIPWLNVIDSTHKIFEKYEVKSVPKMFLIDKNAKIIGVNLWGETLKNKLDSLLIQQ